MKLGPHVLLEIFHLVQFGLINQCDISEMLRGIDLEETEDGTLDLTNIYIDEKQKNN